MAPAQKEGSSLLPSGPPWIHPSLSAPCPDLSFWGLKVAVPGWGPATRF